MDVAGPAYCRAGAFLAFRAAVRECDSPKGLFRAGWAIALHEKPEAELAAGETALDNLADTVRRRVRSQSPEAMLAHLHDVMFDVIGFRGNTEDYYNPANSYLPDVLRTRRGLPITLALVYRRVAAGLGIVVHGVNAPGHFLVEVEGSGAESSMYVDPFFGGGTLTEEEVYARIAKATGQEIAPSRVSLERATGRVWLARMLHNLQAVFARSGRERDLLAMQELEAVL